MENDKTSREGRELNISRTLNAPIELVWEAWTNPEHIAKWWGPDGFTNTITTMDMVPGGEWNLVMHGPDGTDYKNKKYIQGNNPVQKDCV
ncbi:SRPBCC domain-containing protein [Paucibacter sp. O1-1]|nr:SRPBCC domain-containing protein [Paucibacter sp. O1-1]MDA3826188.1 SRPBCC domain-containing protein [Paucibacter sp. O1-1]